MTKPIPAEGLPPVKLSNMRPMGEQSGPLNVTIKPQGGGPNIPIVRRA